MISHAKSGAIALLVLLCIFLWGKVSSANDSLVNTAKTLAAVNLELSKAIEEIDDQNAKITRFEDDARQRGEMLVAAVKELETDLPKQIKRDIADPADAKAMNTWMLEVFPR